MLRRRYTRLYIAITEIADLLHNIHFSVPLPDGTDHAEDMPTK